MDIAPLFLLIPPAIDYAGYNFHLRFTEHRQYGLGLAYVLTGCHSKKKYKRLAYKDGYWEDRATQRQISTMFSNYLFFEPLYDTSNLSLCQALDHLRDRLAEYQLIQPETSYRRLASDDTLMCIPVKLLED